MTLRSVNIPRRPSRQAMAGALLSAVLDSAVGSVILVEPGSKIAYASHDSEALFGKTPEQLIGRKLTELLHPKDVAALRTALAQLAGNGGQAGRATLETRVRHQSGRWLDVEHRLTRLDFPGMRAIAIHSRDISAARRHDMLARGKTRLLEMIATAAALEQILLELIALIESCADGTRAAIVLLSEPGEGTAPPQAVQHCVGPSLTPAALLAVRRYAGSAARTIASQYADHPAPLLCTFDGEPAWQGLRRLEGEARFEAAWSLPVRGHQARLFGLVILLAPEARPPDHAECALAELAVHIAGMAIERDRSLRQMRYQAHHDELTGLPNRVLLRKTLQSAISAARQRQQAMALMFIDLDHFKKVNDSLGHHVGDVLLQLAAARLHHCLRQDDSVARLGGDEFVITLSALNNPGEAAVIASKALASLKLPFSVEHHELQIGASIGIAMYPGDGRDIDSLMRAADSAMYAAKANGRNNYRFFAPGLDLAMRRRQQIASAMQSALQRGEFSLQYQPQVVMGSTRVCAVEALLRWSAHNVLVRPAEFLPIAEENGLIVPIGDWVLREACQQLARWRAAGFADLKIAVNIAHGQLRQADFAERLTRLLRETGLHSADLQLEIAEPILMLPDPGELGGLRALGAAGVQLRIDDFGIGASNVPRLQRFPLQALKIDRSLVRGIATEEGSPAAITAIIAMAHSLHLEVVAEGVETWQQADFLRTHGCSAAQGYYFGRPLSAEAFAADLRARLARC